MGARYYTFAWTTVLAMRVCAREGKPVIVLDRPNPLGGERLEGNDADPRFASFVGLYPLPIRHGLTIAELAAYHNETQALGCDLTVVPMAGWRREMLWEDTELPWVAPSPNMPTPDTARVYPGGCLLEGTNLSEGRGTTRPFEWVGAPYLDGPKLAAALERRGLPGVRFRPITFEPMFQKWARRACHGVQVHVTDWDRFRSYAAYVALITEARRQAPRGFRWKRPPYEYQWNKQPIDLIAGTDRIRRAIEAGTSLARMEASWRGTSPPSRGRAGPTCSTDDRAWMNALTLLFLLAFVVSVDLRIIAPVLPSISESLPGDRGRDRPRDDELFVRLRRGPARLRRRSPTATDGWR